jgi:nucleoid-associated protein YejK
MALVESRIEQNYPLQESFPIKRKAIQETSIFVSSRRLVSLC